MKDEKIYSASIPALHKMEPQRHKLPYPLPLPCCPPLQRPRARPAIRHLDALQLAELLRHIQRVRAPLAPIEQVMLRRQFDELREIVAARRSGDAHGARPFALVQRARGLARVVRVRLARVVCRHVLYERRDRRLRGLLAEGEPLHVVVRELVVSEERQGLVLGRTEDLGEVVPRELVERGGEELRRVHLAR